MGNFNYIDFVTTQKHKLNDEFITNLVLEHLVKDYLNNNNIVLEGQLDEGIIDFVKKVKNQIKDSKKLKDLANFVKVLKDTRKPKAVMEFITLLKKIGVDIRNRKQVLASLHILGGGENNLNEEKVPKETINSIQQKFESNPSIFGKLQKIVNQKAFKPIFGLVFTAVLSFSSLYFEVAQAMEDSGDEITNTQDIKSQVDGDKNAYRIAYNAMEKFVDGDQTDQDGGEDIDQGELATDTAEIEDAKSQGLDLNLTGDETVNFTKYDNGSSQLDDEGKQKIASENSTIIDYLQNGQDYSETIIGVSSNTGENANVDAQGGDLSLNRANNTADYILDNLESQLNEEGIEYERTGNTIKVEGGGTYTLEVGPANDPGTLNSIDKTNDTATQAAWRVGAVDGVIAKKTKIRTNASSASQTIVSARGIKEGDKIYCDKIPKGESVIVRTVNTSTGVVGLSQSLNLTAGDKVEFKRFRRYAINLVEDMCGDIDPEFRKIEFDPYGWKDKIWPTTWFSLYQNLETDISIVNSWKDTNIGTITKLNNVNTGLSKGAPLTIKTYGVVGQNYHEVKISLLIDLFDAAHTFTGARKPSNFAPWAPKRLDSNNNLIAGVSKNFWTNTNPKENGGTRFQIKNWSHDGLGENTITINYTMCISRFGTEPVTLEVKIDDILSHA